MSNEVYREAQIEKSRLAELADRAVVVGASIAGIALLAVNTDLGQDVFDWLSERKA